MSVLPRVAPVMRIFWPEREKRLGAGVNGVRSMLWRGVDGLGVLINENDGPSSGEKYWIILGCWKKINNWGKIWIWEDEPKGEFGSGRCPDRDTIWRESVRCMEACVLATSPTLFFYIFCRFCYKKGSNPLLQCTPHSDSNVSCYHHRLPLNSSSPPWSSRHPLNRTQNMAAFSRSSTGPGRFHRPLRVRSYVSSFLSLSFPLTSSLSQFITICTPVTATSPYHPPSS